MMLGRQMCMMELGWQPGVASVGAGRRCYSNAPVVSIAFLLLGGNRGHAHTGRERDSVPIGRSGGSLVTRGN